MSKLHAAYWKRPLINEPWVAFSSPYQTETIQAIRLIPGARRRWVPELRVWLFESMYWTGVLFVASKWYDPCVCVQSGLSVQCDNWFSVDQDASILDGSIGRLVRPADKPFEDRIGELTARQRASVVNFSVVPPDAPPQATYLTAEDIAAFAEDRPPAKKLAEALDRYVARRAVKMDPEPQPDRAMTHPYQRDLDFFDDEKGEEDPDK